VAPEATDCLATAALLRGCTPLAWASHVAMLLSPAPLLTAPLWIAGLYFAFRLQFDAALFEQLARDPAQAPAALDRWLAAVNLRRPAGPARSIAERCAGARRLARQFVLVLGAQFALTAFLFWRGKS